MLKNIFLYFSKDILLLLTYIFDNKGMPNDWMIVNGTNHCKYILRYAKSAIFKLFAVNDINPKVAKYPKTFIITNFEIANP